MKRDMQKKRERKNSCQLRKLWNKKEKKIPFFKGERERQRITCNVNLVHTR